MLYIRSKGLPGLALLTVTTQLAYARCTGEEASYLINEIYGISNNNVTLKSIHPEAASSVAKICGSCYLRASKECNKRYVEAINQYLPLISLKLKKKPNEEVLNKYLKYSDVDEDLRGCQAIGDYQRSIVNPSRLTKCGTNRRAVLCKVDIKCEPGSEVHEEQGGSESLNAVLTCIGDEMGTCPNLKNCLKDEMAQNFEINTPVRELEPQKKTSKQ